MKKHLCTSVVLSTYNEPKWLEKVIIGFQHQTELPDEIVIADDGSTHETKKVIDSLRAASPFPLIHIWQEDDGFQKTKILNKALHEVMGEYIVFTDGDCIPRNDFVKTHKENAQKGYFLSGGYFKLPLQTSQSITAQDIKNGNAFNINWLANNGLKKTYKTLKLTALGWQQKMLNFLTPAGATWNGHNASGWLTDILHAKGFDERMQYGGEDRELGERLFNAGIKSKQLRYSAVVVHLDHKHSYVQPAMKLKNNKIRIQTKKQKLTQTLYGLNR
ncbi:MAG: glycosyltransferase family 2 protein [Alteromonadaceae bacterium]|nr:glycosyltransferase family 2 protein [Alteromonadaceae bacterium]